MSSADCLDHDEFLVVGVHPPNNQSPESPTSRDYILAFPKVY
jgi:hypothetical protein